MPWPTDKGAIPEVEPLPFWWDGDELKLPPGLYVTGQERVAEFDDILVGETYPAVLQRLMLAIAPPSDHLPDGPTVLEAYRRADGFRVIRFWEIHPEVRSRWAMQILQHVTSVEQ